MRKLLDSVYSGAGWLAALFMIGILAMVLASVFGRLLGFNLGGSDAYAGYCMAASSFLALAHTLKRGEHIRVTLLLEHSGQQGNRVLEIWCHAVAAFISAALAWFSIRLVWQSYTFHDISQNSDATPLWIPQLSMAIGAAVLCIAFVDDLIRVLQGVRLREEQLEQQEATPAFIE